MQTTWLTEEPIQKKLTLSEIAETLGDSAIIPESKIKLVEQIEGIILEHAFRGTINEPFVDEVLKTVDALFECDGENTGDMLTVRVNALAVYVHLGEYEAALKKIDEILKTETFQAGFVLTKNDLEMLLACRKYQIHLSLILKRYENVVESIHRILLVNDLDEKTEADDVMMEMLEGTAGYIEFGKTSADVLIEAQQTARAKETKKKLSDILSSFQKEIQKDKKSEEAGCGHHLSRGLLAGFPKNDMMLDLHPELRFDTKMLQFLARADRWEDVIHLCQYMIAFCNKKKDKVHDLELFSTIKEMVRFYQELGYAYFRTNRWTLAKKMHQKKQALIREAHVPVDKYGCHSQAFFPAWWYRFIIRNDYRNGLEKEDQQERIDFLMKGKENGVYTPNLFSVDLRGNDTKKIEVSKLLMQVERDSVGTSFQNLLEEKSKQVCFVDRYDDPVASERALLKTAMELTGFIWLGPAHSTYLTLFEALSQVSTRENALDLIEDRNLKAIHVVNVAFPPVVTAAVTSFSYSLRSQMKRCLRFLGSASSTHSNPLYHVDASHERWKIFQACIEYFYPSKKDFDVYNFDLDDKCDFSDVLTSPNKVPTHIHMEEVLKFYEPRRTILMDAQSQEVKIPQIEKPNINFFEWALQGRGGTVRDNSFLTELVNLYSMNKEVELFLKQLLQKTFPLEEKSYEKVFTAIWDILIQNALITELHPQGVNPIFRMDPTTSLAHPLCQGMSYTLHRLYQTYQPQKYDAYMARQKRSQLGAPVSEVEEETEGEEKKEREKSFFGSEQILFSEERVVNQKDLDPDNPSNFSNLTRKK